MFGQLLSARLKAAEKALGEGRLDEAFRLASNADLKDQKRAKSIVKQLAKRFFERARTHFHADRFAEALSDLERAEAGGASQKQIDALRGHIGVVAAEAERQAASRRARLDAAKERIDRGSLAGGRRMLEKASATDLSAKALQQKAEDRSEDVARMIEQARDLTKKGRFAAAAKRILRAKSIESHGRHVADAEASLCEKVIGVARAALIEGRVDRAADELRCLGSLGDDLPSKQELNGSMELCAAARRAIEQADYGDARRHVMSLMRTLPKAKWAKIAGDHLDQMDELCTALAASPLGGRVAEVAAEPERAKRGPGGRSALDETILIANRGSSGSLPDRLLLLVDGGGSYLLHRGPQISIGRAACDRPADIAILGDLPERCANIARVDDDYFLFAAREVEVGGKKYRQKLLRDGDRVVLGTRAKFTFRLPSKRSATATIDLSDTTKMPQDVRRVLLFDRHATIGQGGTAHVRCHQVSGALMMFEKEGGLWIRCKNDGHVDVTARGLVVGEPLEVAGATLVLQPWRPRKTGSGWV